MSDAHRPIVETSSDKPHDLTAQEAIAGVLVAAVAIDGVIEPEERVRITDALTTANVLRQAGEGAVKRLGERAMALAKTEGLSGLLTACAKTIPHDLRPTAFALAVDLILADGDMDDHERTFVDQLQTVLWVDDATAARIVDVLQTKNRS